MTQERRDFLKIAGGAIAAGAALASPLLSAQTAANNGTSSESESTSTQGEVTVHQLPTLPYDFNALEPHIDATTMEIHHGKHHQSYVTNLNQAEVELAKARSTGDFNLIQHWSRQLSFNYGGHYLHSMFWKVMAPTGNGGGGEPSDVLSIKLSVDFGSVDLFRKQFTAAASRVEGSGWALLHYRPSDQRLIICQAEKQHDLALWGATPILGIDVWEHAYYIKYQNKRPDYIQAWWNVVNWSAVSENLQKAMGA
ncbi:MAG: superoxide dismutase [candidate division Zixibacteria bacterium]|nr:superoxide dismutase [candidate division Zixibacteria bacterium]